MGTPCINIRRRRTVTFRIDVKRYGTAMPMPLDGSEVTFVVKHLKTDLDSDAAIFIKSGEGLTHDPNVVGRAHLTIPAAKTAALLLQGYHFEVRVREILGLGDYTPDGLSGRVVVADSITPITV